MSLRRSIAHFLGIGAWLFVMDRVVVDRLVLRERPDASRGTLVVSNAALARLRAGWMRDIGRAPTSDEWDRVIDAEVDDELLLREARRRGFHRSDAMVRRRLAQNIGFARLGDSDAGEMEAYALGLDKTDLVVRRRLIQKMKLLAFETGDPSDDDLIRYLSLHADRFEVGERIDLQHIFFGSDGREDPGRDATAALAELDPTHPNRLIALGDPFIHGLQTGLVSRSDLMFRFGDEFARSVFDAVPGVWHGPVASSFGSHLVWVSERRPARVPPLEVVRAEVTEALRLERSRDSLRELLDDLRRDVVVVVDDRVVTR